MRTLVVLIIALLSCQLNAQTFGVKAGFNFSSILQKDDDGKQSKDYSSKLGFHIGGTVEFPINDMFIAEGELLIETKGFKFKEKDSNYKLVTTLNTVYIDIPLRIKYTREINENIIAFGAIGPYFGFAISGKIKFVEEYMGSKDTEKQDVEWGNDMDDDDLKRFDAGISFAAGVEVSVVIISISYDLGLANISSYTANGSTVKNRVLRLSVAYRLEGLGG